MKYLLLIVLLVAIQLTAGCVSESKTPTTTISYNVVTPTELPIEETQKIPITTPTKPPVTPVWATTSKPVDIPHTESNVSGITPEKTQVQISESALKARIQDAKNKLDMLKESDKAETIVYASPQRYGCDFKKSKELAYAIDCNSGDMFYVKGDYGRIDSSLFEENMIKGHTYVILHTHSGDWERCNYVDLTSYQSYYNTFSIADLALASSLTEQDYHIQKMILVSDTNYEVYPKTMDGWKTKEEVYNSIDRIEKRMDVNFHFRDSEFSKTIYFVDSLMPLLTKELDYVYIQKNNIVSF
jgi:predicted CoA-binding protein